MLLHNQYFVCKQMQKCRVLSMVQKYWFTPFWLPKLNDWSNLDLIHQNHTIQVLSIRKPFQIGLNVSKRLKNYLSSELFIDTRKHFQFSTTFSDYARAFEFESQY